MTHVSITERPEVISLQDSSDDVDLDADLDLELEGDGEEHGEESSISAEETEESMVKLTIKDVMPIEFFIEYFEGYEDEDFLTSINAIIQEYVHLCHENEIFIQYLKDNEPAMLSTFEEACKKINELQLIHPIMPQFFEMSEEVITADTMAFMLGPQINISTRADLVARYMDELGQDMLKREDKALRQCKRYKARIEESAIRIEEIEDAIAIFEQNIVIGAVDPITQRIPAEKFIQFMNDWMKNARFITERIRLNTSYMKVTYKKLQTLFEQKSELGVSLCNSDFEAFRIKNEHLYNLIEQKNSHLVELKQIIGSASLELATTRKSQLSLEYVSNQLKHKIKAHEKLREAFTEEVVATSKELGAAKTNYFHVKKIIDNCKAPDTQDYLRVKHRQTELIKEYKVLCRQENLQTITQNTYEMNLTKLTHRKSVDPNWYLPVLHREDIEDDPLPDEEQPSKVAIASEFDIFKAIQIKPAASTVSSHVHRLTSK